jgi:hypothetical protein
MFYSALDVAALDGDLHHRPGWDRSSAQFAPNEAAANLVKHASGDDGAGSEGT